MLTPTFSNTLPRISAIVPPPPPGRCHSLRSKRPAGTAAASAPAYSSSIASNAAQIRSRSAENHAAARRCGSVTTKEAASSGTSRLRQLPGLTQRLEERDCPSHRDVERSVAGLQGDHDPGRCRVVDEIGD